MQAVDDVSFTVARGETLSIVGESGCGKSTLGRTVLGLMPPTEGAVWFDGWRLDGLARPQLRKVRRHFQVVFQDPMSSLSPRMRVRDIIAEPLRNFGLATSRSEIDDRVAELLDMVSLPRDAMGRFAHEFSGGQRQRICIARALAPSPSLIVCDEAVSAARCLGQGADRQPAFRAAEEAQHVVAVYQPRSGDRRTPDPSRRGNVSRRDRRNRRSGPHFFAAEASLYPRADFLGAGCQSRYQKQQDCPERRCAEPDQSAKGMQVSHALPEGL
ncbi:ABC-type lipoprotein export system ATPase subunit [Nitrobacteraceae bacterium AZCC 2299]